MSQGSTRIIRVIVCVCSPSISLTLRQLLCVLRNNRISKWISNDNKWKCDSLYDCVFLMARCVTSNDRGNNMQNAYANTFYLVVRSRNFPYQFGNLQVCHSAEYANIVSNSSPASCYHPLFTPWLQLFVWIFVNLSMKMLNKVILSQLLLCVCLNCVTVILATIFKTIKILMNWG